MAICLNHFILIDVCSVDILVARMRVDTAFVGDFFRETHLWEHFGQTDKIALTKMSQEFKRIRFFS